MRFLVKLDVNVIDGARTTTLLNDKLILRNNRDEYFMQRIMEYLIDSSVIIFDYINLITLQILDS